MTADTVAKDGVNKPSAHADSNGSAVAMLSNDAQIVKPELARDRQTSTRESAISRGKAAIMHTHTSGDGAKTAEKHGHRRVMEDGTQVFKKAESNEIMSGIQFGLGVAIGSITPKEQKDILMKDFKEVQSTWCPRNGTQFTPAHSQPDFSFITYAPKAFRYFRDAYGIKPADFLLSLCTSPLQELSNPGASGSLFYLSPDDNFIIKTVSHSETTALTKMLPGYFLNLTQNTKTLLPKFFGLFCYKTALGKNIRFVIMNNILPTNLSMDEKFDLKGSTYKRQASQKEEQKKSPTLKDLNIRKTYNGGIYVEQRAYDAILRTLRRDCRVMQSFGIMDYSLLLGVHRLTEKSFRELGGNKKDSTKAGTVYSFASVMSVLCLTEDDYLAKDSDMSDSFNGGVLGFINNDQPVLLFLGVIDILQTYRIRKKLEHIVKASYADGKTISVCEPKFYASRFQDFLKMEVFTPISADVASGLLTGARQKWRLIPNKASPDVIDEAEGEHSLGQTSDGGSTEPLHGPAEHIDTARIHTRHVERDSTGFHHATPRSVSPGHRAKAVHADVGEVHRPTHTQGGMVREGERPAEIAALATVP